MCFSCLSVKEVGHLAFLIDEMVVKIALVLSWRARAHRTSCQSCYFSASGSPSASSCRLALPGVKFQKGPSSEFARPAPSYSVLPSSLFLKPVLAAHFFRRGQAAVVSARDLHLALQPRHAGDLERELGSPARPLSKQWCWVVNVGSHTQGCPSGPALRCGLPVADCE